LRINVHKIAMLSILLFCITFSLPTGTCVSI